MPTNKLPHRAFPFTILPNADYVYNISMVTNLSALYFPITAIPAQVNEFLPSQALQPYIRCFWGSTDKSSEYQSDNETIIPDTCMDIIWEIHESTGRTSTVFSGINDTPFEVSSNNGEGKTTHFGIRFHFWAVHYFCDDHLRDVLNAHVDVDHYFGSFKRELGLLLEQAHSMNERIVAAETYLLRTLERKDRTNHRLMNAVYTLVEQKGVVGMKDLEDSSTLSGRQLERLFQEYIGISPKKVADLVRFQNVWKDIYCLSTETYNMQDIIYSYGFSHQSHFINNFKKYAGRTPLQALNYAGR